MVVVERDLKVLVVSRLYPRPTDPVLGVFVEEEALALSKQCQIRVVSPAPWFPAWERFKKWYAYSQLPLRETRKGIEVFRPRMLLFPRNLLFGLLGYSLYLSLRRWMSKMGRDFPFDLIHAHTAYPDGFGAVMLGRALHKPTIVTVHGGDVTIHLRHALVGRLGRWALSHADRVIAVSSSLQRTLAQGHGIERERVTVIPNGVDVSRFTPTPPSEARARLGLHEGASRILYVGAIAESKGLAYLLRALPRVRGAAPGPVELVLVGEGEYERAARALADQLGIGEAVTFAGQRPNEEIPLWINACDVLVLPSLSEGLGVVLLEALACGKPLVATACGGPEDVVTPEVGILVPPADEVALAEALLEVLADARRFHPQRVRQRALDNYDLDRVASRISRLYEEVLRSQQRQPDGRGADHRSPDAP
jgi:teichuronic acid biosynthesis glycosyltransferase TuaC